MEIKHTQRGFEIIEFEDYYKQSCSLQQSSIAIYEQPGAGYVWLGVSNERMHLDEKAVMELVKFLNNWLDTGSFQDAIRTA